MEFWEEFKELSEILNKVILGYPLYKIVLALLVLFLFLFLRKLFLLIVVKSIRRLFAKTKTEIDDKLIEAFHSPLSFLLVIVGFFFAFKILGVEPKKASVLIKVLITFTIFWAVYNLVNVFQEIFFKLGEKFGREFSKEIGAFLSKLTKSFIIITGAVAILQQLGINVSALIASLGIGGLAVALAARDTVANFFGGLTILLDRTFRIGEWIKVGEVEGIVEDIGLRTTKVRTFEKSLITIPNQALSTKPVENFSRRSVRRIKMTIGLTYDTTREQMVNILKDIREMLKNHPRIDISQTTMVYFTDFGESSLNIFVYCFTDTADWKEYLSIREDVNLKIMEIVEKHGASFAFPSRSIYIEKMPNQESS